MVIGRVYKICTDEKYTDQIYIGSTFQSLEDRFVRHRIDPTCSSSILFDKYGYENFHIELIGEYDVIDRDHLEVYETLWINKYRNKCVNQCVPFCIRKLYKKHYRKINRDVISERNKIYNDNHKEERKVYYEANKPAILEERKIYYEANKPAILERHKAYNEANRDAILERMKTYGKTPWTCEICNITMRTDSKSKHLKTKNHQNNLSREQ